MRDLRTALATILTAAAAAVAATPAPVPAQEEGAGAQARSEARADRALVQGTVLTEGSEPVAGATVTFLSAGGRVAAALTDQRGGYRALVGGPGRYQVVVEALGYRPAKRSVELGSGGTTADFRLERAPVALRALRVSAARTSAPAATLPGSITVLRGRDVAEQPGVAVGMGSALSQLVPGLSAGTESASLYGQAFRGRNVAVLIDGVPQSTSRNVMRDFAAVDPSAVERVEVLRGATSVYGDGATGGVINIITRDAAPGGASYRTAVTAETSPAAWGEGSGMRVSQSISGRQGVVDYLVTGSWGRTGVFYDAEGDAIPPDPHGQGGVAEFTTRSGMGKAGATLGSRRVELAVSVFDGFQATDLATDPAVNGAEPGSEKARALEGLSLAEKQATRNVNAVLSFRDASFLGGDLRGQAFYRDYMTRFAPFDGRSYLGLVAQSYVDSEKHGVRLELERALPFGGEPVLVVGVDYTGEDTYQGLGVMDPDVYDASGGLVFEKIGDAVWVPPIASRGVAAFAQLAWSPVAALSLRGGLRHERVRMSVDDFTTVAGDPVEGGRLDYDPVLLNLGAVLSLRDPVAVFAAYSQGFSLADIGRVLRGAPAGFTLGSNQLEAQLVDHYEVGVRALWERVQLTASSFYNESELGTRLDAQLNVVRAPEKVYGVELSADARVAAPLTAGGTFTWTEGESYHAADDAWKALDGYRIQPLKLTGYLEHASLPGWTNRLQVLHSGRRERAFEDGIAYGGRAIEAYTVVDLSSRIEAGPGTLSLGVENLFGTQYYPVVSQLMLSGNMTRAAGRGTAISVGYAVSY